ncbi:MAG TPA: hypothetical protein VJM47_02590 [Nitrosospira sp.]|nr:hypothetical protein [Nitrosospira sp.]
MKKKLVLILAAILLSTAAIAENLMKYLPPEILDDPDKLEHAARIAQEEGFGDDAIPLFERAAFLRKKIQDHDGGGKPGQIEERQRTEEEFRDNFIINELLAPRL